MESSLGEHHPCLMLEINRLAVTATTDLWSRAPCSLSCDALANRSGGTTIYTSHRSALF